VTRVTLGAAPPRVISDYHFAAQCSSTFSRTVRRLYGGAKGQLNHFILQVHEIEQPAGDNRGKVTALDLSEDGQLRARSHCRFAPPRIHCIPDPLTFSVPLFLKRQCGRTLGQLLLFGTSGGAAGRCAKILGYDLRAVSSQRAGFGFGEAKWARGLALQQEASALLRAPRPQPRADEALRGAQTKHFLCGAPKNHDHYGLSIFCMDKR
jgi:hypothetical protein